MTCAIPVLAAERRSLHEQRPIASRAQADRIDPRDVDDAAQLGKMDRALFRARIRRDRTGMARGRPLTRRAAQGSLGTEGSRACEDRRPLRRDRSRARPTADHHRALLRRAGHAVAVEPRPRRCRRGDCDRSAEGCHRPAAVDAPHGMARIEESVQPERPRAPEREAVPVAVHEHARPRRVGCDLRRAVHPGNEPCVRRGCVREPVR